MKNPLVSICIPAYNSAQYIEETLYSLISQTYRNIEIIVSDNASTDNTEEIVERLKRTDGRIKFYRNKKNIGYVKNIFETVKRAHSDYIAVYHADDIYEPTIIEEELHTLLSDNTIGAVFVKHREFWNNRQHHRDYQVYRELVKTDIYNSGNNIFIGDMNSYIPLILKFNNFFACPSFFTKKKLFFETGGFTNKYPSNEDFELWIKYLKKGYRLAIINKTLLNYRRTNTQGSSYYEMRSELYAMYTVIDELILTYEYPFKPEEIRNYHKNKSTGYLTAAFNAYNKKEYEKSYAFLSKSKHLFLHPLLTKTGLMQRFPGLFFFIRRIKRNFENRKRV